MICDRHLSSLGWLAVLVAILVACAQPGASDPQSLPAALQAADSTTYTLAVFAEPVTLDPALAYEVAGAGILMNTHNSLIFYNKSAPDHFVPELALAVPSVENGGISADGLTYRFNIRSGVKFHNGADLTPEDVAYTFQRGLLQGGSSSPQWLLAQPILGVADVAQLVDESGALIDNPAGLVAADVALLQSVCQAVTEAIVADPTAGTVTFHLQQPWAPFLPTLAHSWGVSIVDKGWISANGGWDGDCATWQNYYGKSVAEINQTAIGTSENGTGPYILDHWTPGEEYVLRANENYWRTEPAWTGGPTGAPALKRIVVKTVAEFGTRFAMLRQGDADAIALSSPTEWLQLETLVGEICNAAADCQPSTTPRQPLRVYKGLPTVTRNDVFFNWQVNTEGGNHLIGSGQLDGDGIPPDFFSNVHIRKAFAYCFDWETYIRDVQQGEAVQSYNVMLPGMIGYDDEGPHYTYNPEQCKAEFDTAADELQEQYGADLREVGFRFTIAYNTGATERQTVAQILQQNINAINEKFVIEVTGLPWANFLENQNAGKLPIYISGWVEDMHDPHNWVVPYTIGYHGVSQSLPAELRGQFGAIIDRAVAATDPAERAAIYAEFNQLYYDQAPTILLSVAADRRYERRWVKGWFYNPILPGTYFYSMAKE